MRLPSGSVRYGVVVLVVAVAAIGCSSSGPSKTGPSPSASTGPSSHVVPGIHKIKHVIVIMQENRSFDSYFGTFPGADGIPMEHGVPTVCVPDPTKGDCVRPYISHKDIDAAAYTVPSLRM
jgi:hypothetical protein